MKLFKLPKIIALFLVLMPAISSADEYFEPVKDNGQLLGCWKRINFSESSMKKMNESEPHPLEHQWYCFFENGKYWELHSNKDDNSSMEERLKIMKIFPGIQISCSTKTLVEVLRRFHEDNVMVGNY